MRDSERFDLITMGRAIVDIYAEQTGCRLEDVSSFSKYVGGCPANIAIGTARLGLKVAMITRVGDEQHGRFVREQLAREGVDVSCVRSDPDRLTGVAFLGIRDRETFPLLHYRDDCADMAISPEDYDAGFLARSTAFLFSGSHLTIEAAARNVAVAVERARSAGTKIVFDIDFRPLFWNLVARDAGESRYVASERATDASQRHLAACDLLVGTEEEIRIAAGCDDTLRALEALRERTGAAIVLKRGADGSVVFPDAIPRRIEDGVVGPAFPVEVFNLVGAGDGFLSGFLSGWLRGQPWDQCCRRGNACGAIVVSRRGCSPASPTAPELEFFLNRGASRQDLHRDLALERVHRVTTRRSRPDPVFIIACDHVAQLETMPRTEGRTVAGLKTLVAEAALELSRSVPNIGVIFDGGLGSAALARIGGRIPWVGRKIEATGMVPLGFHDGLTAGVLLREWPRYQIVKCLVPDAKLGDALQEERLRELQHAVDAIGIELLLELVHRDDDEGLHRVLARIRAIQSLGVFPDWWKLPAFSDPGVWPSIEDAIRADNPECRGILLLGAGRDLGELAGSFRNLPRNSLVKGFAVGRTLFSQAAENWLAGRIGDAEVIARLADRFRTLVDAWPANRSEDRRRLRA